MDAISGTYLIVSMSSWTGILQLILMAGVLAYGIWHLVTRQPFNLLILIFWIVVGYLVLAMALLAAGVFYRGQGMADLSFAVGNFMEWAMTVVLFGFLPMTLLAALANHWAEKRTDNRADNKAANRSEQNDG